MKETDIDIARRLIKAKTDIDVPLEDIQASHSLGKNSGSYIVRFANRRPGSAWEQLCDSMMTGEGMTRENVFLNFQLTKGRADISFHVRKAKREKKIHSYSVDPNGVISVRKVYQGSKKRIGNLADLSAITEGSE